MVLARQFCALGAVVAGLLITPAFAQGTLRSEFGDWQMRCETPAGASFEQCYLLQNVTSEADPNVGLSIAIFRTADQQARILRVRAPLGVLLARLDPEGRLIPGLGLTVDGVESDWIPFLRCLPNGCFAEVELTDEFIQTLSTREQAYFSVFRTPEEGIGIPVSLEGFAEGYAALP